MFAGASLTETCHHQGDWTCKGYDGTPPAVEFVPTTEHTDCVSTAADGSTTIECIVHTASPGAVGPSLSSMDDTAVPSDLTITEIFAAGADDAVSDWFEVSNPTDAAIDTANLFYDDKSADTGDKDALVLDGGSIPAGGSAVFVVDYSGTPDAAKAAFVASWGDLNPGELLGHVGSEADSGAGLGNGGDAAVLFRDDTVVDSLAYTTNRASHWNTFTPRSFSAEGTECCRPTYVQAGNSVVGSPFCKSRDTFWFDRPTSLKSSVTIADYNFVPYYARSGAVTCPPAPPEPAWMSAEGAPVAAPVTGSIRVTELYSGSGDSDNPTEDWFELTNLGVVDVSTAGWCK